MLRHLFEFFKPLLCLFSVIFHTPISAVRIQKIGPSDGTRTPSLLGPYSIVVQEHLLKKMILFAELPSSWHEPDIHPRRRLLDILDITLLLLGWGPWGLQQHVSWWYRGTVVVGAA